MLSDTENGRMFYFNFSQTHIQACVKAQNKEAKKKNNRKENCEKLEQKGIRKNHKTFAHSTVWFTFPEQQSDVSRRTRCFP